MKKLLALLLSVLILATSGLSVFGLSIDDEITTGVPALSTISQPYVDRADQAKKIVANDNYIFVARGKNTTWVDAGAVDIFDKATGAYITRIRQNTTVSNTRVKCPVKDIWVDGNTLYITWGNALNQVLTTSTGTTYRAAGNEESPLKYYDVTTVTADTTFEGKTIESSNAYSQTNAPYTWGASSYLDAENDTIYASAVKKKSDGRREYYIMNTDDPTSKKRFVTNSMDAAKFVVKDGWLFEILQDKAGFTAYTGASTMTGNNEVRIYDLNSVIDTLPTGIVDDGAVPNVTEHLKAKYVTPTEGAVAINDIEIIGNTMYVATTSGIEVVDITSAKADGITSAVTLRVDKTITEEGKGGVMELKNIDGKLWAGFYGPELYSSMGETVSDVVQPVSGDGALVVYTAQGVQIAEKTVPYGVADFLVEEDSVYVVHDVGSNTRGTSPKMSAYSIEFAEPEFNAVFNLSEEISENIPAVTNISDGKSTLNSASKVVENDKYIFVAMGVGAVKTLGGAVAVYDKLTGEYITKITQVTSQQSAPYYNPVRDIEISGDTLYIYWGNGISDLDTGAGLRAEGYVQAPVKSYDVSNITEETVFSGTQLTSGNAYAESHAPYTWGGTSYLDEVNGKLYMNFVQNASYARKPYRVIDTTTGEVVNAFYTPNKNTAKFIVKDGWLFEILQNKAGLTNYTGASTMDGNNEIRIFNLNGALNGLTSIATSAGSYLRGVYTATIAGDAVIKDVEVIGDTMYVATTAGIDVVDLTAAKADGVTSSTAVPLTASKTIPSAYGAAMDLEVVDGKLFAGFAGAEVWGAMSDSTSGAVIVYDADTNAVATSEVAYGVADIKVNEEEQRIYIVNDTVDTGSVSALSYTMSSLVLEAEDGETTTALKSGKFNVKVNLSNVDSFKGVLICAFYEGDTLSNAIIKVNPGNGIVTVAEKCTIGENVTHAKTMFFENLDTTLAPLCDVIKIKK